MDQNIGRTNEEEKKKTEIDSIYQGFGRSSQNGEEEKLMKNESNDIKEKCFEDVLLVLLF